MSTHRVPIVELVIVSHENADALEIAQVKGYQSIVRKGDFQSGDLAVYIPEASIVPAWILEKMGLQGKLAGPEGNRVKAIRLRGVLSQGLILKLESPVPETYLLEVPHDAPMVITRDMADQDVSDFLQITKYEPPIPVALAGEVFSAGFGVNYDIENIKSFPDVLKEGEEVILTEKIHGTFCQIGALPDGTILISSQGLAAQKLAFKLDSEANKNNLYVRAATESGIAARIVTMAQKQGVPVFILGEVFGDGVQDLGYNEKVRTALRPPFRAFDVCYLKDDRYIYWDAQDLPDLLSWMGIPMVPILAKGPFSADFISQYTDGLETVSGKSVHMREGCVVRPAVERRDSNLGRVILKSISGTYLTRKGGTEFN